MTQPVDLSKISPLNLAALAAFIMAKVAGIGCVLALLAGKQTLAGYALWAAGILLILCIALALLEYRRQRPEREYAQYLKLRAKYGEDPLVRTPVGTRINMRKVGEQLFPVQPLPDGGKPIYLKGPDEEGSEG